MLRSRSMFTLIATLIALALAHPEAKAQVKPFKITGEGVGPHGIPLPGDSAPHTAVGNANFLGKYSGAGEVETLTADFNADGTITGTFQSPVPFVFTAANGDNLACFYGNPDHGAANLGTFTLVPVPGMSGWYIAHWVAEFVPYDPECTGRFQGVRGGWIMYATSDPFELGSTDPAGYSWEGEGKLDF
jgi:hypothetical protein